MSLQNISNNADVMDMRQDAYSPNPQIQPANLPYPRHAEPEPPPLLCRSHLGAAPLPPPIYLHHASGQVPIPPKPHCTTRSANDLPFFVGLVGVVLLLVLLVAVSVSTTRSALPQATAQPAAEHPQEVTASRRGNRIPYRGKEALIRLRETGGSSTFACSSEEAYDQFMRAALVGDREGMMELAYKGQAAMLEAGIRVLVLDPGMLKTKVRIRSGKHEGQVAWMRTEDLDGEPQ